MDQSKRCPRCEQHLPRSAFHRNSHRRDGLVEVCKECAKARRQELRGEPLRAPNAYRDDAGKTCPRCEQYKPWSSYRKRTKAADGHQTYCNDCCRIFERERDRFAAVAEQARAAEKLAREPTGTKQCSKCGSEKPRLEFYAHRTTGDGRGVWCRDCCRDYQRARYAAEREENLAVSKRRRADKSKRPGDMEKQRLWKLRLYGLTPRSYNELLAEQGDRCIICHEPGTPWPDRTLRVDHDHETGLVRGLLCDRCNVGLGHFRDDIELLARAIEYLRNPPAQRGTEKPA